MAKKPAELKPLALDAMLGELERKIPADYKPAKGTCIRVYCLPN